MSRNPFNPIVLTALAPGAVHHLSDFHARAGGGMFVPMFVMGENR